VFNPDTAPFGPLFWQPVVDVAARSFAVAAMQIPVRDGRALAVEIETFAREPDGGLMVLGRQWLLLPGLALEAIPGLGVLPFWLLVVGAIAVLGTPRPIFERH